MYRRETCHETMERETGAKVSVRPNADALQKREKRHCPRKTDPSKERASPATCVAGAALATTTRERRQGVQVAKNPSGPVASSINLHSHCPTALQPTVGGLVWGLGILSTVPRQRNPDIMLFRVRPRAIDFYRSPWARGWGVIVTLTRKSPRRCR